MPCPDLYNLKKWTSAYCAAQLVFKIFEPRSSSILTTDAANEPFSQRRRWPISSGADSNFLVVPYETTGQHIEEELHTRNVSLGFTGFNVCKCPSFSRLGNKLETQDTIFGQEHVLSENVHSVDTLRTQAVCHRVITMEVLFQWSTLDCFVTVSGEGTGQHGDVTETAFQRLVCKKMVLTHNRNLNLMTTNQECWTSCTRSSEQPQGGWATSFRP